MSEYRLAEKPALDALAALGWQVLSPAQALAMREEENRVILKPVLVDALRTLNGIGAEDAEAIYNDLATLSDNEEWQRKLRGGQPPLSSRASPLSYAFTAEASASINGISTKSPSRATLPSVHPTECFCQLSAVTAPAGCPSVMALCAKLAIAASSKTSLAGR